MPLMVCILERRYYRLPSWTSHCEYLQRRSCPSIFRSHPRTRDSEGTPRDFTNTEMYCEMWCVVGMSYRCGWTRCISSRTAVALIFLPLSLSPHSKHTCIIRTCPVTKFRPRADLGRGLCAHNPETSMQLLASSSIYMLSSTSFSHVVL